MQLRVHSWLSLCALALATVFCGCQGDSNGSSDGSAETEEHGHDHDHGHAHGHEDEEVGPNGGHVLNLNGDKYAAEWLHDDETDTVTVFILDPTGKEELPIPVGEIYIDVVVPPAKDEYVLPAVSREGDPDGEHAKFELSNGLLLTALKMEGGVSNTLRLEIDGEIFTAPIVHHDHGHHHGHSH